ncbi:alpha-2,8-polysialyltransferase family protein [Psychrobacter sp. L7]|uniref:alpha-2,8-polysialyltransferase family protein n=1 Tax=Psychrobacter sp. L7 TaxID=1982756 RepID=UPI001562AA2E|nr:alpha-2,8-polysialyltransferase family protein [Psychrobacter sp. L7]
MVELYRDNAYFIDFVNSTFEFENLFVVSNLGQLNHTSKLIAKNELKSDSNCLLVLCTSANVYVPQNIHDRFDSELFDHVFFLEIPRNPNRISLDLSVRFTKIYSELLNKLVFKNLYVGSFQYHYSILISLAKDKGIVMALVEEGLGTYRLGVEESCNVSRDIRTINIKAIARETIGETEAFKRMYKRFKLTKQLVKSVEKFVVKIVKEPQVQANLLKLHPSKHVQAVLLPHKDYDKAYTSFPELTSKIFNVRDSNFYFSHADENVEDVDNAHKIISKYNIQSNDYLYLSQKFHINRKQYVKIISDLLLKFDENDASTIFIKLHPKQEHEEVMQGFINLERESYGRVKVIRESDFLIEELVRQVRFKGIIGITSSALVYSQVLSPDSKIYSVVNHLTNHLTQDYRNVKGIKMMQEHKEIIMQFDGIEFV